MTLQIHLQFMTSAFSLTFCLLPRFQTFTPVVMQLQIFLWHHNWHFMQIGVRLRVEFELSLVKMPFAAGWCSQNDYQQMWRSFCSASLLRSLWQHVSGEIIRNVWLSPLNSQLNYASKQLIFGSVTFSAYLFDSWRTSVVLGSIWLMLPIMSKANSLLESVSWPNDRVWPIKINKEKKNVLKSVDKWGQV